MRTSGCTSFNLAVTFDNHSSRKFKSVDSRSRLLGWIGAFGGLMGLAVLNLAPLDDLLPINQTLFALDCTLLVIWLLVYVI